MPRLIFFLVSMFRYFDKDKNGYLDRGELTRLLLSYGEVYTKRDRQILDNFMESMDKNGDGKIDIEGVFYHMSQ